MQRPKINLLRMYVLMAIMQNPIAHAENTKSDNNIYAALKWTFGEGIKPEAVIGLRRAKINTSGDVDGQDFSLIVKLFDGLEIQQVRGKYFNGKENIQSELSLGFDLKKGMFSGVGLNAPYLNTGIDIFPLSNYTIQTYLHLDTVAKYKRMQSTQEQSFLLGQDPGQMGGQIEKLLGGGLIDASAN